ncbi:transporter substrate-binding domain-containing protein [Desulfogranum mediterraneum]|uniref:transporter substrate-binding domain-containing protein n=1 Tax=Desulfogranum mediterraneum TaxID=160661 RepID=UPI00048D3FD9|nr:transporter substrate-binding domain-containing protein [Desulfogranum mediterraneum]
MGNRDLPINDNSFSLASRIFALPTDMKSANRFYIIVLLLLTSLLCPASVKAYRDKGVIQVGYEPDLAPLNYDDNNTVAGFSADLLRAIFAGEPVQLVFVPLVKSEAITAINTGEIDLFASIPFSRKLTKNVRFSEPFYTSSVGILTPKTQKNPPVSIANFSGRLVSLQKDTVEYDFLRRVQDIKYQVSNSQHTALEFFFAQRADIFVGNVDTARYYLKKLHLDSQYQFSNPHFMSSVFCFGVAKDNVTLLYQLNSGLSRLKSTGVYNNLYRKWFGKEESRVSNILSALWKVGVAIAAVFLLLLYIGVKWNRELKRQVDSKTADLIELNSSLVQQVEIAKNNNEFLNQIIESSLRGIIIINRDGAVAKHNRSIAEIFGYSEKLKGKSYQDIAFLDSLLKDKFDPVLIGSTPHFTGEFQLVKKNSTMMRHVRYCVYPLYQYNQEIIGIILTIEDISREVEVRKKLFDQEKHRALSRMVAGIAHEIRNPLSSIKTFVELIPSKIHNQKFQREISTSVPREITRISRLIESLIGYARQRKAKKELISSKKLIDEVVTLLLHDIKSKGISLKRDLVEDHIIIVDHDQIEQVIINLIINAVDSLSETESTTPKVLEVSSYATDQSVILQVKDNGPGMTPEELSNALEPFYTTKPKGTGLGLPLAQQLVKESGGELLIASEKDIETTATILFNRAERTVASPDKSI